MLNKLKYVTQLQSKLCELRKKPPPWLPYDFNWTATLTILYIQPRSYVQYMPVNAFKNILTSIWVQWTKNIMTRQIWMDFASTHEELGRSKKNCRIQVECKGIAFSNSQVISVSLWKNLHLIGWMQPHMWYSSLLDQYCFGLILFWFHILRFVLKFFLQLQHILERKIVI